jgi:hypothetical protein
MTDSSGSPTPSPSPSSSSRAIIRFDPALVDFARQFNVEIGKAYVLAGRELCRLMAEMMRS